MNIIVLDTVSKSITARIEGAHITTAPSFVSAYADATASAFTEGANNGMLNGTTEVAIVAAPAASTRRIIREMTFYNADTVAHTLTISLLVTATYTIIKKVAIGVGETYVFSNDASSFDIVATINTATAKTTPVDADRFGFWDSVSGLLNHVTWANVKATLKTYFDGLYSSLGHSHTSTSSSYPGQFDRLTRISGGAAAARTTLVITPAGETMNINVAGNLRIVPASTSLDVNASANWITTTYATAANRVGKDFRIYAIENGGASAPLVQFDLADTAAPASSRLIGGFHCLCVAVGVITGHTLSGYVAGDILPQSVWDLKWCPQRNSNGTYKAGMVYSAAANIWVDIYLMSGTGTSTLSVNGGVISNTRNWMDFIDDAGAVGKRLLRDREFQLAAAGCNEGTNITGSADPVTTGGHNDTAGRRMISNIGCEDMAGVMWQWLDEQSYRYDAGTWSWKTVTGGKGQLYTQDSYGDVKLIAGGPWVSGASCGSRSRRANSSRWDAATDIGGRAGVEPE